MSLKIWIGSVYVGTLRRTLHMSILNPTLVKTHRDEEPSELSESFIHVLYSRSKVPIGDDVLDLFVTVGKNLVLIRKDFNFREIIITGKTLN